MTSVAGQTVFVTGGANGVGAAVARRVHAKGANVVLVDVDGTGLAEIAAGLGPDRVLSVVADVRDLTQMQAAAEAAVQRFGGIDVTLANAGIASYGSVLQVDPDAFKRVIDINVLGVFHTVRATLPAVLDAHGYVLVVSSLAAYTAAPALAAYNTSKAAVEQFANSLRLEVTQYGVAVGSAHMSWVDTPMVRDAKAEVASIADALSLLPFPLNQTTSVDDCAEAFVAGIERRSRHVDVPRWVGLTRWLRPVFSTALGEAPILRAVPDLLRRIDAEVAGLGRSVSAHVDKLT